MFAFINGFASQLWTLQEHFENGNSFVSHQCANFKETKSLQQFFLSKFLAHLWPEVREEAPAIVQDVSKTVLVDCHVHECSYHRSSNGTSFREAFRNLRRYYILISPPTFELLLMLSCHIPYMRNVSSNGARHSNSFTSSEHIGI